MRPAGAAAAAARGDGTLGGQLINPERGLSPEGDTADVETEIANVRRALDAMECDR